MDYLANHDVHHNGVATGPNGRVEFSAEDHALFREGIGPIAALLAAQAIREDVSPALGTSLADQSTAQLAATAAVLGLGVGEAAGRDALIFAIEGARERLAVAARENPVRTAEGERSVAQAGGATIETGAGLGTGTLAGDGATGRVPVVDGEVARRLEGERPPALPNTGEVAPRVIPELAPDMDRARLVEIATEHQVPFAVNASQTRLRELIEAARLDRATPPAPPAL